MRRVRTVGQAGAEVDGRGSGFEWADIESPWSGFEGAEVDGRGSGFEWADIESPWSGFEGAEVDGRGSGFEGSDVESRWSGVEEAELICGRVVGRLRGAELKIQTGNNVNIM